MTERPEAKRSLRSPIWWVWTLLAWVLLPLLHTPAWASRSDWVKRVGAYQLVKWSRPLTADPRSETLESIVIQDGKRRQVACITNHTVDIELIGDLTNDGWPEVVLMAADVGAHGPIFYYIYSLGPRARCLLAYSKGNIDDGPDSPDFEAKDLDGDGRKEIVTWYDGFAYWVGGGSNWSTSFAGAARVPVVLGFRHGRYIDATPRYRRWLHAKLLQAKKRLLGELKRAGGVELNPDASQSIIEYYAIALLIYKPVVARRHLGELLPEWDWDRFLRIHRLIERIVAARYRRYAYPHAYGSTHILEAWAVSSNSRSRACRATRVRGAL